MDVVKYIIVKGVMYLMDKKDTWTNMEANAKQFTLSEALAVYQEDQGMLLKRVQC